MLKSIAKYSAKRSNDCVNVLKAKQQRIYSHRYSIQTHTDAGLFTTLSKSKGIAGLRLMGAKETDIEYNGMNKGAAAYTYNGNIAET